MSVEDVGFLRAPLTMMKKVSHRVIRSTAHPFFFQPFHPAYFAFPPPFRHIPTILLLFSTSISSFLSQSYHPPHSLSTAVLQLPAGPFSFRPSLLCISISKAGRGREWMTSAPSPASLSPPRVLKAPLTVNPSLSLSNCNS